MMFYRIVAGIVGASVFGVMAHAAVLHSGGYSSDVAPVLIVLSLAAIAAALISGDAWHGGQRWLAAFLMLGVLVAEYTNLQRTAEHLAVTRTQAVAPLAAVTQKRDALQEKIVTLRADVTRFASSERLERALQRQKQVATSIATKAAERGCASNCRALLQAQSDAAADEVSAARQDLGRLRKAALDKLRAAELDLSRLPVPREISPLASWLHLPAHWLDLSHAGGMSIAMLLLGAGLLHYAGGHTGLVTQAKIVTQAENVTRIAEPVRAEVVTQTKALPAPDPADMLKELDEFAMATIKPANRGKASIGDIRAAYLVWCDQNGREPICERFFATAMTKMLRDVGLEPKGDVNPTVSGVKLDLAA